MPDHRSLDVEAIRKHFAFAEQRRVPTNNAASTQPPRELVSLLEELVPEYENVHRGQSRASRTTTARFEAAYDTIAAFIHAPSRQSIVACRNATEASNAVMYMLMTEFRDGDNVVATLMEHNSNYVPWYGLCRDILPRFGTRVECRLASVRPCQRRAGSRPPRTAGGRPDEAGLLHRRVELPRDARHPSAPSGS